MLQAILSPKAKQDLRNIGVYTEKQWGRQQRITYINQLFDAIDDLTSCRSKGRHRTNLPQSPYSYHLGRHLIFYRPVSTGIEIIRILHDSMDFERHL